MLVFTGTGPYSSSDREAPFNVTKLLHIDPCQAAERERGVNRGWRISYTDLDGTQHNGADNSVRTWCRSEPPTLTPLSPTLPSLQSR